VKDGIKYGFCAFAPNRNTIQITDYDNAKKIVKNLDAQCDIVIVSFHGGAEGTGRQHITRNDEYFLGENRGNVYKFARKVIDAGADVVFGHGPHVTRAVDLYKDRFIIYSLGNFCTYSKISIRGACGIAPILKLFVDKEGKFLKAKIIPTYQVKYEPPRIDQKKRVIKKIQELTKQDIPETELYISEDGLITRK
jgi:poly-gamma-glutamate capsule biosynthesis protein CapA/YwtB (metallophosphatase superfamily)